MKACIVVIRQQIAYYRQQMPYYPEEDAALQAQLEVYRKAHEQAIAGRRSYGDPYTASIDYGASFARKAPSRPTSYTPRYASYTNTPSPQDDFGIGTLLSRVISGVLRAISTALWTVLTEVGDVVWPELKAFIIFLFWVSIAIPIAWFLMHCYELPWTNMREDFMNDDWPVYRDVMSELATQGLELLWEYPLWPIRKLLAFLASEVQTGWSQLRIAVDEVEEVLRPYVLALYWRLHDAWYGTFGDLFRRWLHSASITMRDYIYPLAAGCLLLSIAMQPIKHGVREYRSTYWLPLAVARPEDGSSSHYRPTEAVLSIMPDTIEVLSSAPVDSQWPAQMEIWEPASTVTETVLSTVTSTVEVLYSTPVAPKSAEISSTETVTEAVISTLTSNDEVLPSELVWPDIEKTTREMGAEWEGWCRDCQQFHCCELPY